MVPAYDSERRSFVNRREFVTSSAAVAALAGGSAAVVEGASTKRALMKLGCQSAPSNEKHFQYFARYGVRNVCGYPEITDGRLYATLDELKSMTDLADKCDVSIDCAAPPFLTSSHID